MEEKKALDFYSFFGTLVCGLFGPIPLLESRDCDLSLLGRLLFVVRLK